MVWDPPEPAEQAFAERVRRLIRDADAGARLAAGITTRAYRRPTGRRCVGCGCPHDEKTRGCRNCISRHTMRARSSGHAS